MKVCVSWMFDLHHKSQETLLSQHDLEDVIPDVTQDLVMEDGFLPGFLADCHLMKYYDSIPFEISITLTTNAKRKIEMWYP